MIAGHAHRFGRMLAVLGTLSACGAVVHLPADGDVVDTGASDGSAADGAHDATTEDGGLPIRCPMKSTTLPISACRRDGETCVRYCYEGVTRSFLAVCKAGRWEISWVKMCEVFS